MTTVLFRGEGKVEEIRVKEWPKEAALRTLVEKNLGIMFPGHSVLDSEFEVGGLRVDTVAFNEDFRYFVIIEYKNVESVGAIEQGMAYLQLLDEKRADFFHLYQQVTDSHLKIEDIAWDEARVVVIAPAFTKHQIYAAKRTKDPIELYRIARYEDGITALEKVAEPALQEEAASRMYSVEYHLYNVTDDVKNLYKEIKNKMEEFVVEGINTKPTKTYIKICLVGSEVLCTVQVLKKSLNLCYATKKLNVADNDVGFVEHMINEDNTPKGKQGLGDYMSKITNTENIERAMLYVKEVYAQRVSKSKDAGPTMVVENEPHQSGRM